MYQILENFHALWWPGDKATAAKNHMDFKVVGERFYPNSPNILLILLICRKTNIKNVSFSGNQLCEVNCSTLELFLNIRK